MLNAIIRFSLRNQLLIIAAALFALGYGGWEIYHLPIDVFPNLNRPRVVVITEVHGMAPEEIEALVTFPIESSLNGASGVQAVRSSSGVGISVINVEFDWGTDIYTNRQIVAEKLQLAAEQLPDGVIPQMAPISSLMGQIVLVGMWSESGKTSPLELRTMADWQIRQRLLSIPGVSQVFVMGGQRKQYQVLVNPDLLLTYGVTLGEVEQAVVQSNTNVTGGYLDEQGPHEYLVRSLGRVKGADDLRKLVVTIRDGRPVLLGNVARIVEGPQVKRGDSTAYVRVGNPESRVPSGAHQNNLNSRLSTLDSLDSFAGGPAVVLTINKQPEADTRRLTQQIVKALEDLERSLPADVHVAPNLYQQKEFIDLGISNVAEALLHGSVLVVIILLLFLLNFRTTFITLTAIPLSIVVTGLVFRWFGLSINTMTLGGLAVAIGELVDDAIVDVENIYRRLKENRSSADPKPALLVVYQASIEVRNSIVFGTLIVVVVFIPLFALSGMEGRLFVPLATAYIVSILSSLLVSLSVTPVLSYWLLPQARFMGRTAESVVLRALKRTAGWMIAFSLRARGLVLAGGVAAVALSGLALLQLENDFLPPFNEGAVQLNVILPPGTSLERSRELGHLATRHLRQIEDVETIVQKTGRAEQDEHAAGVNVTEIIASFRPSAQHTREQILEEVRRSMDDVPGVDISVEQPLAHLISHMLSGVKAQIAIKIYGDELDVLQRSAERMQAAIADVPGVRDLLVEQRGTIPQLRIELDYDQLALYGLKPNHVNELIETAMQGRVTSQVLQGVRTFDLLVRLDEPYREDLAALRRLAIDLPERGTAPLSSIARIAPSEGPNTIGRENARRRIVLQCNVSGRGLVDVVRDIQQRLGPIEDELPSGYFVEYGGQFESQQSASRVIAVLFVVSLLGMFLLLFTMFHSVNLALQVMAALPMAFIGAVAALLVTGQTLTIAAMVGFISLCGIATRNGILLLNHYLHLVRYEGENFTPKMIIRAGQERVAPVLMTALTSGIGLVPLALAAGEPGKEILYPVATVIIGGLTTSTLLDFLGRPALFWTFGRHSAQRLVDKNSGQIALRDQDETVGTAVYRSASSAT